MFLRWWQLVDNNNAAAVLMFPLAQITSTNLDSSLLPFAIIIMFGASSRLAIPMGYQTNLAVRSVVIPLKTFLKLKSSQCDCWSNGLLLTVPLIGLLIRCLERGTKNKFI